MNFEEKIQKYVNDILSHKYDKFNDFVHSDNGEKIRKMLSPFELYNCAANITVTALLEEAGLDQEEFIKETNELQSKITSAVFEMNEKFKERDNERTIAYRKTGLMLATIGARLYAPEYYLDDCITKMFDENDFTADDAISIMEAGLFNISYENAMKMLDIVNNHDLKKDEEDPRSSIKSEECKKDLYYSIESGKYDTGHIFTLLENKEITAIDIMQNVSSKAYSTLMAKLSEYNKFKSDKTNSNSEQKPAKEKSSNVDIFNMLPPEIKKIIINKIKKDGLPDNIYDDMLKNCTNNISAMSSNEKVLREKVMKDSLSEEEIIRLSKNNELNLFWVMWYYDNIGKRDKFKSMATKILLDKLI